MKANNMPIEYIVVGKFSNAIAGAMWWLAVYLVDRDLHLRDGLALVIIGWACSYYLIPALVAHFSLSEQTASFLAFFTGIIARQVIIEAKRRLAKKIVDKAVKALD